MRVARPTRKTAGDVFINVPFDTKYERLYLALVTGVVGLGLTPRCVVEVPHDRHRLERILALIGSCPFSIHDLSRVQLATTKKGFRVPRFNMPFELGLAVAIDLGSRSKRRRRWRVFEQEPYRLTHSLTDLNGYDQYTHHGRPERLIQELRNVFVNLPAPPINEQWRLRAMFRTVMKFRQKKLPRDIFAAKPFAELVTAATAARDEVLARRKGPGPTGQTRRRASSRLRRGRAR